MMMSSSRTVTRRLAQAELVDAAVDGLLRLGDGALADAATRPRGGS